MTFDSVSSVQIDVRVLRNFNSELKDSLSVGLSITKLQNIQVSNFFTLVGIIDVCFMFLYLYVCFWLVFFLFSRFAIISCSANFIQ